MKTARILFVFMLGILFIFAAQKKKPKPPLVEQRTVQIPGNKAWTDTGFILRPNDKVTITASGQVCFSNGEADSGVDPDGYPREAYTRDYLQMDNSYCQDPHESWNHAALIGGVESDVFLVGKNKAFFGKDGMLYLGINDCSLTGQYFNTGSFTAVVKVERAPKH